ncbi:MAG: ATP-binding cassette domain-containing protein [Candidatus Aureabacteria bacterium]|nr:ATP-binding cassette domain-containing protein [Candidatus Auribacterota bacterium]
MILTVNNLSVSFPVSSGIFQKDLFGISAVHHVSFSIRKGEIFGLAGESGCGKSSLGRALAHLFQVAGMKAQLTGQVELLCGQERVLLSLLTQKQMRPYRRHIQMIFQDPFHSLNPRMTIGEIIHEPLQIHFPHSGRKERQERVDSLMEKVGLSPEYGRRFPHELSGGQRQRICIARVLAVSPQIIIADEPLSSLDVSIQAQIVNLLRDLQEDLNLTYIFISHDLSVMKYLANRIAVMYLGTFVEIGETDEVYQNPRHPYTQALFSSIPDLKDEKIKKNTLKGEIPSPQYRPTGCCFRTRCPIARSECSIAVPQLMRFSDNHDVACPYVL